MRQLTGKVVVITGAGGGIGRALAQRFAAAGAVLALSDVDPAAARETAVEDRRQWLTFIVAGGGPNGV
ncbi:MAG: SDR family NAD(P)-dependent oxidoreductase, partial [Saccharopolyspora sp.]|uniref:SDR family NAD(P)-dependent oxidoreductase n=1 Tax=Saccharopolyspora sp. TaxID=33915 RepID=UPI0025E89C09